MEVYFFHVVVPRYIVQAGLLNHLLCKVALCHKIFKTQQFLAISPSQHGGPHLQDPRRLLEVQHYTHALANRKIKKAKDAFWLSFNEGSQKLSCDTFTHISFSRA